MILDGANWPILRPTEEVERARAKTRVLWDIFLALLALRGSSS